MYCQRSRGERTAVGYNLAFAKRNPCANLLPLRCDECWQCDDGPMESSSMLAARWQAKGIDALLSVTSAGMFS